MNNYPRKNNYHDVESRSTCYQRRCVPLLATTSAIITSFVQVIRAECWKICMSYGPTAESSAVRRRRVVPPPRG